MGLEVLFGAGTFFNIFTNRFQSHGNQSRAVRINSSSNVRSPITPQFHKSGILKIDDLGLYSLEIAKVMHQHSKQLLPVAVPISSFFNWISSVLNRLIRATSHKDLYLPRFATFRCQKSVNYQGVKSWNSLLNELSNKPFQILKLQWKTTF